MLRGTITFASSWYALVGFASGFFAPAFVREAVQEDTETTQALHAFQEAAGLRLDLSELRLVARNEPWCSIEATTPTLSIHLLRVDGRLRVVHYRDSQRIVARQRALGAREGEDTMDSERSRRRALELANALVPEWSVQADRFDYVRSGQTGSVGVNTIGGDLCGGAQLTLGRVEPEGPVFPLEQAIRLTIDTLDGLLLAFDWYPGTFEITTRNGSLPVDEARAKAKAVAFAQFGVDMAAHDMTATQGFAGVTMLPGVERRRRDVAPFELRFAWRVRAHSVQNGAQIQDLFVDIDAQTGKVLNLGWIKPKPPAR